MEIYNYTGKKIGLTNSSGNPIQVLPSYGNARVEDSSIQRKAIVGLIPIYTKSQGKVKGLPSPDPNFEKLLIVTRDVAEAIGKHRPDLLIPEDPIESGGSTYYRRLLNV